MPCLYGRLQGKECSGAVDGKHLAIFHAAGEQLARLRKTERRSPTLEEEPPAGAVVLFDGTSAEHFRDDEGRPTDKIRVTVRHNGVVIHEGYDTRARESGPHGFSLQRHGNRVQYHNLWLTSPK